MENTKEIKKIKRKVQRRRKKENGGKSWRYLKIKIIHDYFIYVISYKLLFE